MFGGYRVVKNTKDGFKSLGKKAAFLAFGKAREFADERARKFPGLGIVVVDSAGRPVYDTVCPVVVSPVPRTKTPKTGPKPARKARKAKKG